MEQTEEHLLKNFEENSNEENVGKKVNKIWEDENKEQDEDEITHSAASFKSNFSDEVEET